MSRVLIKGTQITVPNSVGAGTSFSEATLVRLVNTATGTDRVVTVQETAGGTTVGTFTILRGSVEICLLYTSPSPRDNTTSRMPSSA